MNVPRLVSPTNKSLDANKDIPGLMDNVDDPDVTQCNEGSVVFSLLQHKFGAWPRDYFMRTTAEGKADNNMKLSPNREWWTIARIFDYPLSLKTAISSVPSPSYP
ncbi:hypothetical protein TWF481_009179 [Arthrobotrys musiformis]|uniref:Uncharacterized protein n=1 Tax=Arthrobotrys musiformis TaxID=47236 RepID=A0AAV9W2T2_9PEZI